jgi:hypothetical protein
MTRGIGISARLRCGLQIAALVLLVVAGQAVPAAAASPASVRPHGLGTLDCNGFSSIQTLAKRSLLCADPRGLKGGRFDDNGYYIGHDEPSVRFVSSRPGTGNNITFVETLGVDPSAAPTVATPGSDITHYFELSIAPWFSTDVCDPNSFPQLPCTPNRDANAPHGAYPGGGAGFVELQFYPPGFAPFIDGVSCDNTHWCSALNIDSLECTASGTCNNNCVEPVNFAWVQTNGIPTGPPSPQLSDLATFTPNAHTLLMRPGDRIKIHMFDTGVPGGQALKIVEQDLTTGASGSMVASAANGFMNTSIADCSGTPFNFAPEYSSARAQNILPWGIGPYMIDTQFEIGHFEGCTSVSQASSFTIGTFTDKYYLNCHGPYEAVADKGTSVEPDDSPCYRAGDTHGGTVAPNVMTGCLVFDDAVGDLDFDGSPYWPDWPDSTSPDRFPSAFQQQQPTSDGAQYESIQFETDSSGTQPTCNTVTGAGCALPPPGAPGDFYPYWTLADLHGTCMWEFGNMRNGRAFGGDAQYGAVTPTSIGAFTGSIRNNPVC